MYLLLRHNMIFKKYEEQVLRWLQKTHGITEVGRTVLDLVVEILDTVLAVKTSPSPKKDPYSLLVCFSTFFSN